MANPIGLAAGFDKDGEAIDGMCVYAQLTFWSERTYQGYLTLVSAGLKLGASLQPPRYTLNITRSINVQLIFTL